MVSSRGQPLSITADAFSATAKAHIEIQGGKATVAGARAEGRHEEPDRHHQEHLADRGAAQTVRSRWALLLVYRIGSFIVLPGVDSARLASSATGSGGLVELLSIFTGGPSPGRGIFALGIMPYISASIIVQLMGIAVPAVQKMQREESGRRRLNQWTRYLTIPMRVPGSELHLRHDRRERVLKAPLDVHQCGHPQFQHAVRHVAW